MTHEEWMEMHKVTRAFFDNEQRNHAGDFDIDDDEDDEPVPVAVELSELRGQVKLAEQLLGQADAQDERTAEHWRNHLANVRARIAELEKS